VKRLSLPITSGTAVFPALGRPVRISAASVLATTAGSAFLTATLSNGAGETAGVYETNTNGAAVQSRFSMSVNNDAGVSLSVSGVTTTAQGSLPPDLVVESPRDVLTFAFSFALTSADSALVVSYEEIVEEE